MLNIHQQQFIGNKFHIFLLSARAGDQLSMSMDLCLCEEMCKGEDAGDGAVCVCARLTYNEGVESWKLMSFASAFSPLIRCLLLPFSLNAQVGNRSSSGCK